MFLKCSPFYKFCLAVDCFSCSVVFANAEASFITREPNQWYREPYASNAGADSTADFAQSV